jgi:DNA-directed RNA polymerase specialized sigma24 family protein
MALLVHQELRRLAARQVGRERVRGMAAELEPAVAGQVRRTLVEHARQRLAGPVDKDQTGTVDTAVAAGAEDLPAVLVALDEALAKLATVDAPLARLVELHYFGGLAHDDLAAVVGMELEEVRQELRLAEAWLGRELERP